MRLLARTVVALAGAALMALVGTSANAQEESIPCAECHDTVAAEFSTNPHFRSPGRLAPPSDACLACHDGGRAHAEAGGEKELVKVPRGIAGAAVCVSCHAGRDANGIDPKGAHGEAGVTCDSCHAVHGAKPPAPALLREPGSALCVGCHPLVRGAFAKPHTHPMHESVDGAGKAGMQCASCHNPHGGHGGDSLKCDRTGETACMSCHTDKRGPFVYTHPAMVAGSCQSCHEPHGSANTMMLTRSRVSQLCLECHTGAPSGPVGSQPPSLHDLRSPRYQNCTSCHVAVHGSNTSPLLVR